MLCPQEDFPGDFPSVCRYQGLFVESGGVTSGTKGSPRRHHV